MSAGAELLVLLVMAVGVVGTVLPFLPGLALVWAAGLVWAWQDGWGTARVVVAVVLTVLLVAGTVAKVALPARAVTGTGAPRSTVVIGAAGALVGFFVIPVVGLVVGGVGAVYLAELRRLGRADLAWRSTRSVLLGVGLGVLVEIGTGLLMVCVYLAAVLAT